jgi:hypothetical protein
MDFIERWFHVSPDGGNGSLEMLYLVVAAAGLVLFLFRKRIRRALARLAHFSDRRPPGGR